MRTSRSRQILIRLVFGIIAMLISAAAIVPAGSATPSTSNAAPQQPQARYAGPEACKSCHDEVVNRFAENTHWRSRAVSAGLPAGAQGCESCHGPGADHVDAGGDKTKIRNLRTVAAREVSETCLTCHSKGQEHGNFVRSAHANNNVSCVACHSVHNAKEESALLSERQPALCFTCHGEAQPEFAKPFRHRVLEGMVQCSDCHSVHGGFRARQVKSTPAQDAVCFKCHSDKAGPFAFEHAPVKVEGCMSCHTPHGSTNPRMLKRTQVNLLCLECHTFTVDSPVPGIPTFHNQARQYQACTMCHVAIHGSNFSSVFFK